MRSIAINKVNKLVMAVIMTVAAALVITAQENSPRVPEIPAGCENLQADAGSEVAVRFFAVGVQVYWWNGSTWGFVGPMATLYADESLNGKVGTHYGGPTWKTNSGSLVIGKNPVRCTPDPESIPWLLLEVDEVDGEGIFRDVTYIQRVNTQGGKAPSTPGTYDGERVEVPYTAVYVFYRPGN